MMTTFETSKSQTLASFCQNGSFLKTKIALLTFYKIQYSPWTERLILVFEYLQLISQALLVSSSLYKDTEQDEYLNKSAKYAFKLVNPSYLLPYESSDSMTLTVLVILFWCTLLKIMLLANVIYASIRNKEMNSWLLLLWRWTYKLQARVLYFLFTSFWVNSIREAQEQEFSPFGMGKSSVLFVSSLMIALEFGLSYLFETQLCYFLPTKSLLSSKNNHIEMITFLQKFVIQILMLCIPSDSEGLNWVTSIIGIIMSIVRFYKLFHTLPLYHSEALILQGSLLATVMSLNMTKFVSNIFRASGSKIIDMNFVIITWILLALLTNKITYGALKVQIYSLLSVKNHRYQTPEILLHKVIATKELKKNDKIPNYLISDVALSHLISTSQNLKIQDIFGLDIDNEDFSKKRMNQVYLFYYQKLLKRHPNNFLIKLHTAHRSYRNQEPYTKTIKILAEMKENQLSINYLSCSLLLYEIEKSIFASSSSEDQKQNLDLFSYMQNQIQVDYLRSDMVAQTALNLKVCNNILSDISNFEEIHSSAQAISELKISIESKIAKLSQTLPEHYISPYLCYAEYHLIANHSISNFEKYYEIYTQKSLKARKFFEEPNLIQENLYQNSNAFLLISTQKTEYGKISYCTRSLASLCGTQNTKAYQGSDISRLFPPFLRSYYDELYKETELTGGKEFINKVHRAYLIHKNHYLVEVDFYMKYHPYLTQGLCINMIIRPVPVLENAGFLLLDQNGDIMGASKELSKLLNLNKKSSHTSPLPIGTISNELSLMNEAFNMVLKTETFLRRDNSSPASSRQYSPRIMSKFHKKKTLHRSESHKANEIYTAYTSGDLQIQLYPYNENHPEGILFSRRYLTQSYKFSCHVRILNFGDLQIKHVSLTQVKPQEVIDSRIALMKTITKEDEPEECFAPNSLDRIQSLPYDFLPAGQSPTSPVNSTRGLLLSATRLSREEVGTETLTPPPLPLQTTQRSSRRKRDDTVFFLSTVGLELPDPDEDNQIEQDLDAKQMSKFLSSPNLLPFKPTETAETKAYKNAVLSKSYPKPFKGLCFLFYLVLIMTFVTQLIMKKISDDTMNDLQIRKDLLKESEERLYKGALIQTNARGIVLQFEGKIKAGGLWNDLSTVIKNLQIRLHDMVQANNKMLDLVYSLDHDIQDQMFARDIRMNGTYLDPQGESYHYLNAFQVTAETSNAIKALANINTTEAPLLTLHIFTYLVENLVDDFLYKSKEITDILTSSVEKQKKSFQRITNLFLVLNPLLLISIGILLTSIIWNQYKIENTNMRAFIKIHSQEVRVIAEKLTRFKKDLLNEETFEGKYIFRTNKRSTDKAPQNERISAYAKGSGLQQIRYKEFRRRYFKYILRVLVCISALVAITIGDLIITQNAIKVVYNRQSQIQFANYISSRATITSITYVQLFYTNNTVIVENNYPLDSLPVLAEVIKQIQSDIPQKFLEVDGTYNPDVQRIIWNDNPKCENFTPDFINYCQILVNEGQPVNMIVAIAAFQSLITNKILDYNRVDKSNLTVIIEADAWTPNPFPNFVTIAEEAHRVANIMDGSMTNKINEMQKAKGAIIIVFSIGLLVVGVFIWFYILKVIREVYNDFKKVLQIFPVNLVLSSYLLKRFLQQSSGNSLLK